MGQSNTESSDSWSFETTRFVFKILYVIGDLFGLCSVVLLVTWICTHTAGFSLTTQDGLEYSHLVLMSFFVVYLQGNASIVYRLLPSQPKYYTKLAHAAAHGTVCVGMAFGLWAIIKQHHLRGERNFTSLHSWLGLTTVSCYFLQFVFGFYAYLFPTAPTNLRVGSLPVHKFVGRSLFLFAVTTAVTGLMYEAGPDYSSLPQYALMINFAGVFAVAFVATFIYLLSSHAFHRRPPPFPRTLPVSPLYYGTTPGNLTATPGPSSGIGRYEKIVF